MGAQMTYTKISPYCMRFSTGHKVAKSRVEDGYRYSIYGPGEDPQLIKTVKTFEEALRILENEK